MTPLNFRPISIADRAAYQAISLRSGRRNCNFTFADLIGWQFHFQTELCLLDDAAVCHFISNHSLAYMVCCPTAPSATLLQALRRDAEAHCQPLTLMCLEDDQVSALEPLLPQHATIESRRNNYDYIYLRDELQYMRGKNLKTSETM